MTKQFSKILNIVNITPEHSTPVLDGILQPPPNTLHTISQTDFHHQVIDFDEINVLPLGT